MRQPETALALKGLRAEGDRSPRADRRPAHWTGAASNMSRASVFAAWKPYTLAASDEVLSRPDFDWRKRRLYTF
jgi:hypothetical protein